MGLFQLLSGADYGTAEEELFKTNILTLLL